MRSAAGAPTPDPKTHALKGEAMSSANAIAAADAPMQVTLPGSAVTALRKWLDDFLALGPKDQAALPLPMKDVETSIKQCLVRVGSVPARRA